MPRFIRCTDCRAMIPAKSEYCPHCKRQVERPRSPLPRLALWGFIIIGNAIGISAYLNRCSQTAPAPAPTARDLMRERLASPEGTQAHVQCGQILQSSLRNPASLRWDRAETRLIDTDAGFRIVRHYRAENAYGGTVSGWINCEFNSHGTLLTHSIVER